MAAIISLRLAPGSAHLIVGETAKFGQGPDRPPLVTVLKGRAASNPAEACQTGSESAFHV